jgi:RimJ/RimL family protein N-acetyltransferase
MSVACSDARTQTAPVFLTERLIVRRYAAPDLEARRRLRADPEVRRFMHWSDEDDDLHARIEADARRAPPDDLGWINLAVARRDDAALVGDHGLRVERGVAYLGVALMPEARRRGYGAELIGGAMGWLRGVGVARCVAEIDYGNLASFALFTALGFRVTAEKRDAFGPFCVLAHEP